MIVRGKWMIWGAAAALLFNAVLVWAAIVRYSEITAGATSETRIAARLAAAIADGIITGIDRSLGAVAVAAQSLGLNNPVLTKTLEKARQADPTLVAFVAFDALGDMAASSEGPQYKSANVWDRSYFRHHRENPDPAALVGPPFRNRADGAWVLPISRRLSDADGEFLGVVVTGASPRALAAALTANPAFDGKIIEILHDDGSLIARAPSIERLIGAPSPNMPSASDAVAPRSDDAPAPLSAWERLSTYPIAVHVATDAETSLQNWRRELSLILLLAFVGTAALAAGSAALHVQTNRRRRAMAQLAENNTSLERRVAERTAQLESNRDKLQAFLNIAQDAMVVIDNCGRVVEFNPAAERLFGYARDEMLGRSLNILMPDRFAMDHNSHLRHPHLGAPHDMAKGREVVARHRSGVEFPIEVTVGTQKDGDGMIHVGVIRDIRERKKAEDHLRRMASTDSLTGLLNRTALLGRLNGILHDHALAAALMIDADHFKKVNDEYGHAAGDAVLKRLSAILSDCARSEDAVGRWGGEEFVFILAKAPADAAQRVALRILEAVRAACVTLEDGTEIGFRVSIGAAFSRPDDSPDSLLSRADQALYQAKNDGRDRAVIGD